MIVYKPKNIAEYNKLGVKAFAMFQDDEIIKDLKGKKSIKYKEYQVTIVELQDFTGLDFGKEIFDANPLFYFDSESRRENYNIGLIPERIPIDNADNIVDHEEARINHSYRDRRDVAIVSAMVDPEGKDSGKEWVSMINRTSKNITLAGWGIFDHNNRYAILKGTLGSGKALLFGHES